MKSAHNAVRQARKRCWRSDWVLDFDIKGFFDNIDQAIKELNQILNQLTEEKHPDKTYIGKIENGFILGILPSTLRAS